MFAPFYYKKTKCFPFYKILSKSYKCKAVCLLINKHIEFIKNNNYMLLVLVHIETMTRVLRLYSFFEK